MTEIEIHIIGAFFHGMTPAIIFGYIGYKAAKGEWT